LEREPLLFDTDIGSDIDDAVALAYLLCEPRCELLGITTVSGEPIERARLADAVCRAAGRTDIPIHSGCERPLLVDQGQVFAPQKSVLSRWRHRDEFAPATAVPFLQETIRARPGEITLLAVGPFTNLGLLFAMDPEIPKLLKRLVIMGGVYLPNTRQVEWNASLDPHATALVFGAELQDLTAFGLDVTLKCRMPAEECRRRLRGGVLDLVADMAEVWFDHEPKPGQTDFVPRPDIVFHDPLAAVAVFEPDLCRYERGWVEVDTLSPWVGGMTHFNTAPSAPRQIAVDVDVERFFDRYFGVVGR
jgi:purine nucleosidase